MTALIQRFAGGGAKSLTLRNSRENPQNSIIAASPTDTVDGPLLRYTNSPPSFGSFDDWSVISRIALLGQPQGTMGGLLVAGFLFKTVGWRLLVISGKYIIKEICMSILLFYRVDSVYTGRTSLLMISVRSIKKLQIKSTY